MSTLPKNQAEHRQRLYKTEAATGAAVSLHRSRRRDNARQNAEVKGRVYTGAAKQAAKVTSTPDKSGMYGKPACGHLDTQRFLAKKRKPEPPAKAGTRLRVPADASAEEQARMRRWLAQADAISANLNR